jgi:lysophospholipase L1-like esterase
MTARGRLLSGLVTIVIALAGFVSAGALPAAATPRTVQYVALGDSYAAGLGAGPPYSNGPCLQSAKGYPALLDSAKRIDLETNATCSGATTSTMADQLSALNRNTRLVTITVGGNDLDVSGLATSCKANPADCPTQIDIRLARLPILGGVLAKLYADVAAKAPRARIVVTGYPHLFEPAYGAAINEATDALNTTIEQAVSAAQDADLNVHYVDVTAAFAGHGIGSSDTFTNAPDAPDADVPFHPNANGYIAYADAISAALPGEWVDKQKHLV